MISKRVNYGKGLTTMKLFVRSLDNYRTADTCTSVSLDNFTTSELPLPKVPKRFLYIAYVMTALYAYMYPTKALVVGGIPRS